MVPARGLPGRLPGGSWTGAACRSSALPQHRGLCSRSLKKVAEDEPGGLSASHTSLESEGMGPGSREGGLSKPHVDPWAHQ